jgi:hypothetical protein
VTLECPTCGGDGQLDAGATDSTEWSTPPGVGGSTGDGRRYRLEWHPSADVVRKALFRVATADRVATLQHVRTIRVAQTGPSGGDLHPDASLDAVPSALLARMRADGFEPAEEGDRR